MGGNNFYVDVISGACNGGEDDTAVVEHKLEVLR